MQELALHLEYQRLVAACLVGPAVVEEGCLGALLPAAHALRLDVPVLEHLHSLLDHSAEGLFGVFRHLGGIVPDLLEEIAYHIRYDGVTSEIRVGIVPGELLPFYLLVVEHIGHAVGIGDHRNAVISAYLLHIVLSGVARLRTREQQYHCDILFQQVADYGLVGCLMVAVSGIVHGELDEHYIGVVGEDVSLQSEVAELRGGARNARVDVLYVAAAVLAECSLELLKAELGVAFLRAGAVALGDRTEVSHSDLLPCESLFHLGLQLCGVTEGGYCLVKSLRVQRFIRYGEGGSVGKLGGWCLVLT